MVCRGFLQKLGDADVTMDISLPAKRCHISACREYAPVTYRGSPLIGKSNAWLWSSVCKQNYTNYHIEMNAGDSITLILITARAAGKRCWTLSGQVLSLIKAGYLGNLPPLPDRAEFGNWISGITLSVYLNGLKTNRWVMSRTVCADQRQASQWNLRRPKCVEYPLKNVEPATHIFITSA